MGVFVDYIYMCVCVFMYVYVFYFFKLFLYAIGLYIKKRVFCLLYRKLLLFFFSFLLQFVDFVKFIERYFFYFFYTFVLLNCCSTHYWC